MTTRRTSEAAEHAALFAWVDLLAGRYPDLASVMHTPNEGRRGPHVARQIGIRPGVPDVLCFAPGRRGVGLALELKIHPNKPTPAQLAWLDRLRSYGWGIDVVTMRESGDWTRAAVIIADHLGIPGDSLPINTFREASQQAGARVGAR